MVLKSRSSQSVRAWKQELLQLCKMLQNESWQFRSIESGTKLVASGIIIADVMPTLTLLLTKQLVEAFKHLAPPLILMQASSTGLFRCSRNVKHLDWVASNALDIALSFLNFEIPSLILIALEYKLAVIGGWCSTPGPRTSSLSVNKKFNNCKIFNWMIPYSTCYSTIRDHEVPGSPPLKKREP